MKTSPATTGNLDSALEAAAKGYVPIPVNWGTKIPAVRWKDFQRTMPTDELIREWFSARRNLAIICTGLVIFDCDDPAKAELIIAHCGDTPHKVRTPRGGLHLGYRKRMGLLLTNQVRIKGEPIDIRTDGGLEMLPHSETEDGSYQWLGQGLFAKSELPFANVSWTRKRMHRRMQSSLAVKADASQLLYRGRKYVDTFERAVSGQGGHTTTFVSALKIVRFVGFDRELAWQLLLYYNATKCDPPWEREADLLHKLDDAMKSAR